MSKKRFKLTALLLSLVIIIGLLAGCNSSGGDADTTEAPTQAAATNQPTQQGTEPGATEAAEEPFYPITDELTTITAYGFIPPAIITNVRDGNLNNIGNIAAAEEATNIHMDWMTASLDEGAALFGILIASDDLPDILTCTERFYAGGRSQLISMGICVDIAEYAEEWAPDWYKYYSENDIYATSISTSDGKVAQMYTYKDHIDSGPAIRKDWLDDLGMDIPKTYDELTEVMQAFVTEKGAVQGIGLIQDGTFGGVGVSDNMGWLTGGYGVLGGFWAGNKLPWQVDENGKVYMSYTLDGFYDYFSMVHDWYSRGIINTDIFSVPSNQAYEAKMLNGEVGVIYSDVAGLADTVKATAADPNYNIVAMADLRQNAGDIIKTGGIVNGITNFGASVSADSENIEYALKYLNWFWTDEGALASNFGIEGVAHHYDSSGKMYWDEIITNNPNGLALKMAQYVYCGYPCFGYVIDYAVKEMAFTNDAQREAQGLWISDKTNDYLYYGSMTSEETETYSEYATDIMAFVIETYSAYITGDEPLENFWTNIDRMYEMGLQNMIDVKQAAYDRYLAER